MALNGLGLFLLETGAGIGFLLLFFPTEALGKGFFSLHAMFAFAFLALAAVIRPAGLPLAAAIAAAALTGLYALAAHGGQAGRARPILAAGAVAASWAMARVALVAPRPFGDGWTVAGAALGGLFFGAVLLTMNLGHWYLISRSLPFRLLARGRSLRGARRGAGARSRPPSWPPRPRGPVRAPVARARRALLSSASCGDRGPDRPVLLHLEDGRHEINQAATGLLYVALVFVLIGELLSSYLTVATGFPA
jgi:hypothetical protein